MSESARAISSFSEGFGTPATRIKLRPSAREWAIHSILFLLTVASTTFAGIITVSPEVNPPAPPLTTPLDYLLYIPLNYFSIIAALLAQAFSNTHILAQGLLFSMSLLSILTAHEMGHYVACRRYGVAATLPFFLPAPPLFLAGTFGAFIKIKSPIPSRRALFDIGLAGPLAGFIVALPIAVLGILLLQPAPPTPDHFITFNDPLLFRILGRVLGVELNNAEPNPYYMASWIGLLVTSLNLMPVGQLDGGHGTFAVFGQRLHLIIGRIAFAITVLTAVLGYLWHGSPSGFLYAVLLAIMLRVRHPQPDELEPLGRVRFVVGAITLVVFALSFWPFPFTIV
jgi:membrane-associated protease RseP (regulator of RpoE activity)